MSSHRPVPVPGALTVAGPHLRPERGRLALSVTLATLEIGCRRLEPWPLAPAVDRALIGRPFTGPTRCSRG
ncbi:MAG: hypothetical protein JWR66_1961 [Modestobacter sp.]|jgi:hypothetical protein|nr:hypothetical protein [Modestobacter sp.]